MRMGELAERSGVAIATIKWWRREGLLHPGTHTAPNQVVYDASHLARLRLLSVLRNLVDLPTATIREIVAALDDEGVGLHEAVGRAHGALAKGDDADTSAQARALVDELLTELDWQVHPDTPTRHELAGTVDALLGFGREVTVDGLRVHAEAAERVAEAEVAATPIDRDRDEVVADVVIGTILHGEVLGALRRLAHEDLSSRRWRST